MGDPCVLEANHVGRVADDVTVSYISLIVWHCVLMSVHFKEEAAMLCSS